MDGNDNQTLPQYPSQPMEMEAELDVAVLRANLRTDGRKKEEMRELRLEKDSTYRADGSSTVSHGRAQRSEW